MRKSLVLTLTGTDQIGLVEKVTRKILDYGGNVESSRMARLGGEFAMLMLVSIPEPHVDDLNQCILCLQDDGFTVTTCQTETCDRVQASGWLPYQIEVNGADHEGIIHAITRRLAVLGVNVESMDTNMVKAPLSGTPLFMMEATVLAPPELTYRLLQDDLEAVGDELNVDVEVTPYKG
jgi:glycine cleavage system transcriptional repressor